MVNKNHLKTCTKYKANENYKTKYKANVNYKTCTNFKDMHYEYYSINM